MQPLRLAAAVAAALLCLNAASAPEPETIVVHVPLRAHGGSPAAPQVLRSYVHALAALGAVRERRARGSWVGNDGAVVFDPIDDMIVRTRSPRAPVVVRDVLVRMQRDLDQDATLAEVFPDPGSWPGAEHRRRFDARVPVRASAARVARLHRLFDDAGGGATEEDGPTSIDVASSVPPAVASVVRDALALAEASSTETSSAFILVVRPTRR